MTENESDIKSEGDRNFQRVPKTVTMTVAEIVTVTDSVTQCPSDSDKDG